MIKSIKIFLLFSLYFISAAKSQISQIDHNGYNPFCDETLQLYVDFPTEADWFYLF